MAAPAGMKPLGSIPTTGGGQLLQGPKGATPEKPLPDNPFDCFVERITLMLIGLTGSGKTTQIAKLAKALKKIKGLNTRYYGVDRGGNDALQAGIKLGFIKPCLYREIPDDFRDPFIFGDRVSKGMVFDQTQRCWVDGRSPDIGLWVIDSMTSLGDEMKTTIEDSQAGANPIGPKAYNFEITKGADTLTVGTTDKGHYGIMQGRLTKVMWNFQDLPGHILMTANLRRIDQDDETKAPLLGAELAGKALTGSAGRWIKYTWCLVQQPVPNAPSRHLLHLTAHLDATMAMSMVVGNARIPLEGAEGAPVPNVVEPADVVHALKLLARRQVSAEEAVRDELRKELGLE